MGIGFTLSIALMCLVCCVSKTAGITSCEKGIIEYVLFPEFKTEGYKKPSMVLKLSSYNHTHYTDNLFAFTQPLMLAFTSGSMVELRTELCETGDHAFASFAVYSPPEPEPEPEPETETPATNSASAKSSNKSKQKWKSSSKSKKCVGSTADNEVVC